MSSWLAAWLAGWLAGWLALVRKHNGDLRKRRQRVGSPKVKTCVVVEEIWSIKLATTLTHSGGTHK
jgi:hypothetical protein